MPKDSLIKIAPHIPNIDLETNDLRFMFHKYNRRIEKLVAVNIPQKNSLNIEGEPVYSEEFAQYHS